MGFPARLRFGVFEVDLESGELRKQGLKLKLQDQPFQILAALLERPGEIVTREDLRQRLGASDAFGDFDHLVNKAVNKIREVLGDSADSPLFVETLPRRGYRFLAPVESIGPHEPRASAPPSEAAALPKPQARREAVAWTCAAAALFLAAGLLIIHSREKPTELRPIQFQIPLPRGMAPTPPMLSPDGRQVVWWEMREGKNVLWLRSMDVPAISALAGTDEAVWPFWSPDSRFIGFFAGEKLKTLELSTGTIRELCEVVNGALGTWNADGVIVFGAFGQPLQRIRATGGKPEVVREIDVQGGEIYAAFPSFLPDGRHYTYWSFRQDNKSFRYLASLDSKEARLLIPDANGTFYSPPGFMIFQLGDSSTLVAQPFDLRHFQLYGTPIRVADHVAFFSISQTGMLAYIPTPKTTQLTWYARNGKRLSTVGEPAYYFEIMLSPDGERLLFERGDTGDDWLLDLASGVASRMTFHGAHDGVWSSDGREFFFSNYQRGQRFLDLYRKVVGGGEELLFASAADKYPQDWSRDVVCHLWHLAARVAWLCTGCLW